MRLDGFGWAQLTENDIYNYAFFMLKPELAKRVWLSRNMISGIESRFFCTLIFDSGNSRPGDLFGDLTLANVFLLPTII